MASSMFLSATASVVELIVVVVPDTVRLPEIVRLLEIVPPASGRYVDDAELVVRYVPEMSGMSVATRARNDGEASAPVPGPAKMRLAGCVARVAESVPLEVTG